MFLGDKQHFGHVEPNSMSHPDHHLELMMQKVHGVEIVLEMCSVNGIMVVVYTVPIFKLQIARSRNFVLNPGIRYHSKSQDILTG